MDPWQTQLVERIRTALAAETTTREVAMFGGRSFMVNGKIVVSALKGGDLLVRIAAQRDPALLEEPGATRAEMGIGRTMGPGWINVAASSITDEQRFTFWVESALDDNFTPPRAESSTK